MDKLYLAFLYMFLMLNLEQVTKKTNKVCLRSGVLNRQTSKLFRDVLNMAFKMFNEKSLLWQTEIPATLRSPKKTNGAWPLHLDCSNANHWAELPHASPAAKALYKLWILLVDCSALPHCSRSAPQFLLYRKISQTWSGSPRPVKPLRPQTPSSIIYVVGC